jgi:hypothetical protein
MASEYETLLAISQSANGLNPVQKTRFEELQKSGSFGNLEGIESPAGSYLTGYGNAGNADLERSRQLTDQAIGTLQSQKPVIGQIYGQKRDVLQSNIDPTKQRYDALIADLKNQQINTEQQQTKTTSAELARRGILGSSGAAQQELQNVLQPIGRSYAGLVQQTGLAREADIKSIQDAVALLFGEEAAANMSLAGLISQAQLGGAGNALTASGQLISQAQAQAQLRQQQVEAQNQQNYQNAILAMQQQLQPGQILSQDLANQLAQYNLTNKTTTGTGATGLTAADLLNNFGRGVTITEPKPSASVQNRPSVRVLG